MFFADIFHKYLRISFFCCTFAPAFRLKSTHWCHRISVSTQDFHSCKGGSTPPGTTKKTFPKIIPNSKSSQCYAGY